MSDIKKKTIYFAALIAALIYIVAGNRLNYKNIHLDGATGGGLTVGGVVTEVKDTAPYSREAYLHEGDETIFTAKTKNGIVTASQYADVYDQVDYKTVEKGDRVVLTSYDNGENWTFAGYDRSLVLFLAVGAFFACLVLFGGVKGLNTILALLLTGGFVFAVFLPAVLAGKNIYFWTFATCVMSIATTMVIVHGVSKKTLGAIIGCISGVALCAVLMLIMIRAAKLSGMVDECYYYLSILDIGFSIDLKAVVFAGVLIGALGAVMDVSISIATSLWEIKEKGVDMDVSDYFRSCLNIGRDIMGTMTNTLILAYIGTCLAEVLLLYANNYNLLELVNREVVVVQIIQSLIGSTGLLFTIPFTGLVCGLLFYDKYAMPEVIEDDFMPYVKEKTEK